MSSVSAAAEAECLGRRHSRQDDPGGVSASMRPRQNASEDSEGVPSILACGVGTGVGAFAAGGVALVARGPVEALVDGVAGGLADLTVAAPSCAAVGAGRLGGSAVLLAGATVSAPTCGAAVGDGATGGGVTPAQPAVRSTQRSPTTTLHESHRNTRSSFFRTSVIKTRRRKIARANRANEAAQSCAVRARRILSDAPMPGARHFMRSVGWQYRVPGAHRSRRER